MSFKLLLCVVLISILGGCNCWSDNRQRKFKDDFLFGVASSSYQIEGGWDADGKGESIWDKFVHERPQRVADGSNGDVAADSYHLYKRDVEMLRELGVDFYRFSLSWSRLFPNGKANEENEAGFQYYDNLIDELLRYNIEPMVTLYHGDLPQKLEDLGGWISPDIADWFHDYANVVFKRYARKVKYWITVNQPNSVCMEGYGSETGAPGVKGNGEIEYICTKNILLAHAKVYHLFDKMYRKLNKGEIGIALSLNWFDSIDNTTKNEEKTEEMRQFSIGLFTNPIFSKEGNYPKVVRNIIAKKSKEQGFKTSRLPELSRDEIKLIKGSADFLGMNHYTTFLVADGDNSATSPSVADDLNVMLALGERWEQSQAFWLRSASYGLYKTSLWLNKQYDYPPVFITENGWASDRGLKDQSRVDYLRNYLHALLLAIEDGTNVKGYAHWSLMDNFDWIFGYGNRFGLYEVDFESKERTRSARYSASVYKRIIESKIIERDWKPSSNTIGISHRRNKSIKEEL